MCRSLFFFLLVWTTACSLWAYEDYDHDDYAPVYQGNARQTQRQSGNAAPVRRSHASNPEVAPQYERLRTAHTTVRNHIDTTPTSDNRYINLSDHDHEVKSNNKRKSQAYEADSRMVYPSDVEHLSTSANQIKSRACSFGLCDEVDNYPEEKIQRILSRSELKKFFSSEVTTVESRFGAESENLCPTITHTRFPKTAKNMQDKEQVIVNVDQYKQGVVFETCKEEGPCNFAANFPNNFTPTCVQKYTVRKLMVVGKESDDTVFDDFKIPSCCVCMVKK